MSHIQPVKMFGFYSSTGMLLSLGLLFLLLPTLMEKWPLKGSSETAGPGPSSADRRDRMLRRLAGAIIRHHGSVATVCLVLLIALGCGVAFLETAIQPARFFPEDSKWIQDGEWFAHNVGPLVTVEVVLGFDQQSQSSMRKRMQLVREVERQVHAMAEVGGTISAATFAPNLDPGRAVRQAATEALLKRNREFFVKQGYLNETGHEERWRITARLFGGRDVYYDQVLASIQERVDRFLEERGTSDESVTAIYTGSAPLVYAAQQELLRGLMRSFCLAFALIAVVMVLLLRNVWAGVLAMLPNVFPAMVTFGIMGWLARPVDVGAMMTASVALGIAVDDTLHFLTWFRRGRLRGDTREEAIIEAYQRVRAGDDPDDPDRRPGAAGVLSQLVPAGFPVRTPHVHPPGGGPGGRPALPSGAARHPVRGILLPELAFPRKLAAKEEVFGVSGRGKSWMLRKLDQRLVTRQSRPGSWKTVSPRSDRRRISEIATVRRCGSDSAGASLEPRLDVLHHIDQPSAGCVACKTIRAGHLLGTPLLRRHGDAEAQSQVAVLGQGRAAARGSAAPDTVEPAAATIRAFLASCGPPRIVRRRLRIVFRVVPVRAPVPNISMHVVQTKWVRQEAPSRRRICISASTYPSQRC